jgi:hypothetical protein
MSDQFGMFPAWVVMDGAWAKLQPVERAVFGVLVAHRNGGTGQMLLSRATIAAEAGVHEGNVRKALRGLEAARLIREVKRGNGRTHCSVFELRSKGGAGAPLATRKGERRGPKRGAHKPKKGSARASSTYVQKYISGGPAPGPAAAAGINDGRAIHDRLNSPKLKADEQAGAIVQAKAWLRRQPGNAGGELAELIGQVTEAIERIAGPSGAGGTSP